MEKLKIDQRTEECVYITVGNKTVYIDDSTNEEIIDIWENNQ